MPLNTKKPYQPGTRHMAKSVDYEPQRNNNFEVQIEVGTLNGNARAGELITLSVATYAAPQINISQIPISYGNNKIKFAGLPEFPDSNVVLNDYIGINVERLLSDWQKQVYDPNTQEIGLAVNYKKTAYLLEYAPDGSNLRAWQLIGCWPSALQLGDFNQEGGNVRQITMTLTYDYAIPYDVTGISIGPSVRV